MIDKSLLEAKLGDACKYVEGLKTFRDIVDFHKEIFTMIGDISDMILHGNGLDLELQTRTFIDQALTNLARYMAFEVMVVKDDATLEEVPFKKFYQSKQVSYVIQTETQLLLTFLLDMDERGAEVAVADIRGDEEFRERLEKQLKDMPKMVWSLEKQCVVVEAAMSKKEERE
ncbi:MAG: hypothetical protein IKO10_03875 [Lachnospiraceae bacterium]|nr:hypothetical protein [Lachnospiraceae bacterium]